MLYTEPPQDTSGYAASYSNMSQWRPTISGIALQYNKITKHSKLLNAIACRSIIPDVAQIGQETLTQGQKLNYTLSTVRLSLTHNSRTASRLLRLHEWKQMKIQPTV